MIPAHLLLLIDSEFSEPPAYLTPNIYLESRVGTCQVLAGILTDGFKRNKTGTAKRGARAGVIHLGPVKPAIATVSANFIVSAFSAIPVGGFNYVSPGQYLRITNLVEISSALVQDGDTTAIVLTPRPMLGGSVVVSINGFGTQ